MRWTTKARIQRACAALPRGDVAYQQLQRRLGTLGADPFKRLPQHATMLRGLAKVGLDVRDARCVEVGTGHVPVAPLAFWLAGAAGVDTVDLHRRLDLGLTAEAAQALVRRRGEVEELYRGVVDQDLLRARLDELADLAAAPDRLLAATGVRYDAPADAARLPHADGSVDVHFSMTVLEHVEPAALGALLGEARRVLSPGGVAVHFVDPSDHFAHQDDGITRINFLRYSQREWARIAGNEFSYANRLRASQLHRAFTDASLRVERVDAKVDDRALAALRDGFLLAPEFRGMDERDLCTTTWRVYARRA